MVELNGPYYAECHVVFRRHTNQQDLMLAAALQLARLLVPLRLLSVGSGSGLFELPFLQAVLQAGGEIGQFTGIDTNASACRQLSQQLTQDFGGGFPMEVQIKSFQEFGVTPGYKMVLFNHSFEYLSPPPDPWLQKALDYLAPGGIVAIFSPCRDRLNAVYADHWQAMHGRPPMFADEVEASLSRLAIPFAVSEIAGRCDLSILAGANDEADLLRMLSFLAQIDVRRLPEPEVSALTEHFLSMADPASAAIAHHTRLITFPA
jgi:SAM-dependent methyltransferase